MVKTWGSTFKADLEPLSRLRVFDYARLGKDRLKVPSDHRAWSAPIRGVADSVGDFSSTRPAWMEPQVQVNQHSSYDFEISEADGLSIVITNNRSL